MSMLSSSDPAGDHLSVQKIRVCEGKYTFVDRGGGRIDVLRYGEAWAQDLDESNAILSLMHELDAARMVLAAVREMLVQDRDGQAPTGKLRKALDRHASLVGDREPPGAWSADPQTSLDEGDGTPQEASR